LAIKLFKLNEVLTHNPNVLTIDYGLNDRGIGLDMAEMQWKKMIETALRNNIKVILLTPSWDNSYEMIEFLRSELQPLIYSIYFQIIDVFIASKILIFLRLI
jgi:hypothetical protein